MWMWQMLATDGVQILFLMRKTPITLYDKKFKNFNLTKLVRDETEDKMSW